MRYRLCGELIRGLRNLETPCKGVAPTGANFLLVRKFPKGKRFCVLFASAKRTKKQLLGRAKSCQWQVFVRRRPPKQGELRTDVSKATMFQGEREQRHAQRAAPTGACFPCNGKLPKGRRVDSFCFCKKNQKARYACFSGRERRPDAPYFILLF